MSEKLTDEQLREMRGRVGGTLIAVVDEILALRADRAKPTPSDEERARDIIEGCGGCAYPGDVDRVIEIIASIRAEATQAEERPMSMPYMHVDPSSILPQTGSLIASIRAEGRAERAKLEAALRDGGRDLPIDRETLGRMVREAWVRWAQTQPSPKPSWLVPYDELSEADKEADRQIGEAVARWTLIHDAARLALTQPAGINPEPDSVLADLLRERESCDAWRTQAESWEERYAQLLLSIDATSPPVCATSAVAQPAESGATVRATIDELLHALTLGAKP